MEPKELKHGTHIINNDNDGYVYSFNTSKSHDFNSHIHKCYEIIHIINGNMLYNVEGRSYIVSDGDIIMTKPQEHHSFSFTTQCIYKREFLHVYPGILDKYPELKDKLNSRKPGHYNHIPNKLVKKYCIDSIFSQIKKYCIDIIPETDFIVCTCAIQLLTIINAVANAENLPKSNYFSNTKSDVLRSYIDKHYAENITLEDVAAAVYMSPSYTSRIFKKETGMNIKEYINLRRINMAKNLIMEGRKATAIYNDCGFNDYSTFYRAFTRCTGVTPEEFKKIQEGEK